MISGAFTGAGIAVRCGSVVASRCAGFADAAQGRRWSLQTRTQVASISKQFAAAVTLLLVHQGVITLEDSVAALLPDCPAQWRPVSLRHLLTHTSGMAHWCDLPGFDPAQQIEPAQRRADRSVCTGRARRCRARTDNSTRLTVP